MNNHAQPSKLDKTWQKKYDLLKEYIPLEGRLPSRTTIFKGANLGTWFGTQRTNHKAGELSPEREALLQLAGVDFETPVFEAQWQQNYELLKEYISREGHLPSQSVVYKGANLGRWLNTQKTFYKFGKLSATREALLRSVGVDFDVSQEDINDAQWRQNCDLLKEYVSIENRLPLKATVYKGTKLGHWLDTQKQNFKKGKLSPERESLLRSVGVDLIETSRQDVLEAQWQKTFVLLKEYVSLEGCLPIRSVIYKGVKLGAWLDTQKRNFKNGTLTPEREALLRSVGVDFEASQQEKNEAKWNQNYSLFKEYVTFSGHLPSQSIVYKGANIGVWLNNQKIALRAGTLPPARETLLRSVFAEFK